MKTYELVFFFALLCVASFILDGAIYRGLWSLGMGTGYVRSQVTLDLATLLSGRLYLVIPALFVGWAVPNRPLKAALWLGLLFAAGHSAYQIATFRTDYHYSEWLTLAPVRAILNWGAFVIVAFAGATARRDYASSNKSFKPNPLRGSA